MLELRTKVLVESIRKLYRRAAWKNIKRILNKTHAADIAALLEEMDRVERLRIFNLIDSVDIKAEILSYLEGRNQKDLILSIDKTEAQELVSQMESDDAADLLGSLPKDKSQEILDKMERESSEDVADLMRYPEDSAGGLMNTEYFALNQSYTVAQAIEEIQNNSDENLVTFYIYVVDDEEHLVGVLSLKQLILSKPNQVLKSLMETEIISVDLNTDQEEVARIVERYDFLSLPVVNESQKLEGVITVDDVIDVIRAEGADDFLAMGRASDVDDEGFLTSLFSRLSWLLFSFIGGGLCFLLIRLLGYTFDTNQLLTISAMIPLLLSLGATAGGQSATVAVGLINAGKLEINFISHLFLEMCRAVIYAVLFASVFYLLSFHFLPNPTSHLKLSTVMGLQIISSMLLGTIIPYILDMLGYDSTVGTVPIFAVVADILAIILLFTFAV
ncbi:MAG: magnesium transporter [Bdellovibrionales bacterium]|nr:magnesium transporter [Bdellovibrionales bacterium]